MAKKFKIKKGDSVKVLAGKDKGKTGEVLRVMRDEDRVLVRGVNVIKRHTKPNPQRQVQGGVVEKEAPALSAAVSVGDKELA